MQKSILSIFVAALIFNILNCPVLAQNSSSAKFKNVEFAKTYLQHNNAFLLEQPKDFSSPKKVYVIRLNNAQKKSLLQMHAIYKLNIQATRAQIVNEPRATKEYITQALKAIKMMIGSYPEIKNNERFQELYASVYTVYRQFYGIGGAVNEVVGNIFAVRNELAAFTENKTTPILEVSLIQNKPVDRHLLYFTEERPEVMKTWLKRMEKYFPMMQEIFTEEETPVELIHLAMIESGLNPQAQSWASAMGLWQFMKATGQAYGLEVNWWVDERKDPVKSTRAAAQHLKDLYERWGNWHLAIAGYNISPSGLISAIRDGGGKKNYWSAWPHLPDETKNYIPGYIAATMISLNPAKFGFEDDYQIAPYSYDIAKVDPLMPLELLAETADISIKELKEYNPELLRWATPPGSSYNLKLPAGKKDPFLVNYNKIPEDERSRSVAMHTVQSGQTLGYIANRYGTTVSALYDTNEGLTDLIHPGQKIIIPLPRRSADNNGIVSGRQNNTEVGNSELEAPGNTVQVYYTVKRGDTVGHIAEWFDVRSSQIRSWNNTSNLINVGDKLVVYIPENEKHHYENVNSFGVSKN